MMSIACIYLNSNANVKLYTFKYDPELVGFVEVDDYVVVEDVNSYSAVQVKEMDVTPWGPGERMVIQKINIDGIRQYRHKKSVMSLIEARLEEEAEKFRKQQTYQMMAEKNPEIAELLKSLQELSATQNPA